MLRPGAVVPLFAVLLGGSLVSAADPPRLPRDHLLRAGRPVLVNNVTDGTKRLAPGVRGVIDRLKAKGSLSPEQLVDGCLDLLGPVEVSADTKQQLLSQANEWGQISWSNGDAGDQHVGQMLQLIVATREYQFA